MAIKFRQGWQLVSEHVCPLGAQFYIRVDFLDQLGRCGRVQFLDGALISEQLMHVGSNQDLRLVLQ